MLKTTVPFDSNAPKELTRRSDDGSVLGPSTMDRDTGQFVSFRFVAVPRDIDVCYETVELDLFASRPRDLPAPRVHVLLGKE